jgi:hypothetical protein
MHREPTADGEFLSHANRRAIGRNLERIYPIDGGPAFEDLLARIAAVERGPAFRRS